MENLNQANELKQEYDCAVCLQKCHYPTKLPCGHIFCFLCVKGVTIKNKKCAMCRAEIPIDYLDNPLILAMLPERTFSSEESNEHQWYYEGTDGWWRYDERSNIELEAAFNAGNTHCKLLLAGALYCIDFQKMMQMQCRDPSKRRRVQRNTPTLPSKGIAGILIPDIRNARWQTKSESEDSTSSDLNDSVEIIDLVAEEDDSEDYHVNNSQQEVTVPSQQRIDELLNRLRSMSIQGLSRLTSRSTRDLSSTDEESSL